MGIFDFYIIIVFVAAFIYVMHSMNTIEDRRESYAVFESLIACCMIIAWPMFLPLVFVSIHMWIKLQIFKFKHRK